MVAVLQALRQEHADLANLLDIIEAQLEGDDAPDYGLLRGILDYCLTYPDKYHHPKEDLIYRCLCRRDPRLGPVIGDLESEHEELAIATQELSQAVDRARRDGTVSEAEIRHLARGFVEFYRQHMIKEEGHFFQEALRTLTPEEWADIEAEITDPTDPLFRDKSALRLSDLEARVRGHSGAV